MAAGGDGPVARARVVHAELATPEVPAHATLVVDADGRTSTWLLAESWWSKSFSPPTYADLLVWAFKVLPWTIANHFVEQMRHAVGWRKITSATALLAGTALLPLVAILLLVSLLVGILPIPQVRNAIVRVQRTLLGSIGDSYVLRESSVRGAAMSSVVLKDLAWLQTRSAATVIVAHSQGAAVAHSAVRLIDELDAPDLRMPKLLVTFGAGLKKLLLLERVSAVQVISSWASSLGLVSISWGMWIAIGKTWRGELETFADLFRRVGMDPNSFFGIDLTNVYGIDLTAFWVPTVIAAAIGFTEGLGAPDKKLLTAAMFAGGYATVAMLVGWLTLASAGAYSVVLIGAFAIGLAVAFGRFSGHDLTPALRFKGPIRWIDLYASADPVPSGPLTGAPEAVPIVSRKLNNLQSVLRDHTSYWKNRDQFVATIAIEIARLTRIRLETHMPWDDVLLARAAVRRAWRAGWLAVARWLAYLTVAVTVFSIRGDLWQRMEQVPWLLRVAIEDSTTLLNSIPIIRLAVPAPDNALLPEGLWLAAALLVAFAAGRIVRLVWSWWDDVELDTLFGRMDYAPLSFPFVCLLGVLALFVVIAWLVVRGDPLRDFLLGDAELQMVLDSGWYSLAAPHAAGLVTAASTALVAVFFAAITITIGEIVWNHGAVTVLPSQVGGRGAAIAVLLLPVALFLSHELLRVGHPDAFRSPSYSEGFVAYLANFFAMMLVLAAVLIASVLFGLLVLLVTAAPPVRRVLGRLRSWSASGTVSSWLLEHAGERATPALVLRAEELIRLADASASRPSAARRLAEEAVEIVTDLTASPDHAAVDCARRLAAAFPLAGVQYGRLRASRDPQEAKTLLERLSVSSLPRVRWLSRRALRYVARANASRI